MIDDDESEDVVVRWEVRKGGVRNHSAVEMGNGRIGRCIPEMFELGTMARNPHVENEKEKLIGSIFAPENLPKNTDRDP
jgi:hypothetical protein